MNNLLDSGHVDPKALTALLAGSVSPQVHGGAKEICLAFLADQAPKEKDGEGPETAGAGAESKAASAQNFDSDAQERLKKSMRDFLHACRRGLDVNKKVCQTELEHTFQANLDKQYEELSTAIRPLIKERKKTLTRKKEVRFG